MSQNPLNDNLYQSTRTAWENIWETANVPIELETMTYARSVRTLNTYLPYLPKDQVLLEAGSGLSAVLITLRDKGYKVVGLDYAINALFASHAYDPALDLTAGDVHALPFADNSLGAYLSFGVLEHFPHGMTPALAEAYRVLAPNGVLVLTIPYPNLVWRVADWKRKRQGKQRIDEDFYESTYTKQQLIDACTGVGFRIEQAVPTSHAFTLWGVHPLFRKAGYYQTSALAEGLGAVLRGLLPWAFNYMTLVIARK